MKTPGVLNTNPTGMESRPEEYIHATPGDRNENRRFLHRNRLPLFMYSLLKQLRVQNY